MIKFDTSDTALTPTRAYRGDAGYDLRAAERVVVMPKSHAYIPTGVKCLFDHEWFGMICERSSQGRKGLFTMGNVIDQGYTAPIGVILFNTTNERIVIEKYDRIGQIVPMRRYTGYREHALPTRGEKGFGSSGKC